MTRTYVAECELCRTKFETDPGECPVCGSVSLRAIREAIAPAEDIPAPTRRTLPPAAMRRRGTAAPRAAGRKTAERKPAGSMPRKKPVKPRPRDAAPGAARSGVRGATPAARAAEALRRAAGTAATCRFDSTGGTTTIRIDVPSAVARLREARRAAADSGREYRRARAALREARAALSATRNRGTAVERALRRIADWLEDLFV